MTSPAISQMSWEHSHVIVEDGGIVRQFCVYQAPDPETIVNTASALGSTGSTTGIRRLCGQPAAWARRRANDGGDTVALTVIMIVTAISLLSDGVLNTITSFADVVPRG